MFIWQLFTGMEELEKNTNATGTATKEDKSKLQNNFNDVVFFSESHHFAIVM